MKLPFSMYELFADIPTIRIVDVGASPIEGPPPYQALVDRGGARVVGFEPSPQEYQKLQAQQSDRLRFLPYAIGDGKDAVLNICAFPGMTSLFEPDFDVLRHFQAFSEWAVVIERQPVTTHRLDDLTEIEGIDFLKLDVQGSELAVLQGAARKLKDTLVVYTEVQFIPFYKGQPLFAELDQALRQAGFYLHCFASMARRAFKPMIIDNSIHGGLNQALWADAVYVKAFTHFADLSGEQLLKLAVVSHELYRSFDLCALALGYADRKEQTDRQQQYLRRLLDQS